MVLLALCHGTRARGHGWGENSFLFVIADHEALLGGRRRRPLGSECIVFLIWGRGLLPLLGLEVGHDKHGPYAAAKVKKFIMVF